jgi:hypothetical protein
LAHLFKFLVIFELNCCETAIDSGPKTLWFVLLKLGYLRERHQNAVRQSLEGRPSFLSQLLGVTAQRYFDVRELLARFLSK